MVIGCVRAVPLPCTRAPRPRRRLTRGDRRPCQSYSSGQQCPPRAVPRTRSRPPSSPPSAHLPPCATQIVPTRRRGWSSYSTNCWCMRGSRGGGSVAGTGARWRGGDGGGGEAVGLRAQGTGMIRFHALDGSGEGTVTERRWDAGGASPWSGSRSGSWSSVGGGTGARATSWCIPGGNDPSVGAGAGTVATAGNATAGSGCPSSCSSCSSPSPGSGSCSRCSSPRWWWRRWRWGPTPWGRWWGPSSASSSPGARRPPGARCLRPRRPRALPAPAPYRLSGGTLAVTDGPDLYRKRLLEVLQQRYVREISLSEFEARAGRIARDPSARHLS